MMASNFGLQGFFGEKAVLEAQVNDAVTGQNPALQTGMPASSGLLDLLPRFLFPIADLHQQ